MKKEEEEEESGDEWTLSRRGVLVIKAALVLCEATAFPWLSEYYTRPKGDSYYDAGGVLRRLQSDRWRGRRGGTVFESVFEFITGESRITVAGKRVLENGREPYGRRSGIKPS